MPAISTRRDQAKSLSFPNHQIRRYQCQLSVSINSYFNSTFSPCSWVRFEIWSLGQSQKQKNLQRGKDLLLIAMPLHKDFELPQQLLGAFLTFSQGFCHSLIPEPLVHLVVPVSTQKWREMAPKIHSGLYCGYRSTSCEPSLHVRHFTVFKPPTLPSRTSQPHNLQCSILLLW